MLNFDRFTRVATAAAGALVLSFVTLTAAVGPAEAASVHTVQTAHG